MTTPTKTFTAQYSGPLGKEVHQRAQEQCPEGYLISTVSEKEFTVIKVAWNQGIDSYLEAITDRSSWEIKGNRAYFTIHPLELHVLVRRLFHIENPVAEDLAKAICETLGIDLV